MVMFPQAAPTLQSQAAANRPADFEQRRTKARNQRFFEQITQEQFDKLSEGGKAFILLSEKRAAIADKVRREQNIPDNITDEQLIEEFIQNQ